MDLIKIANNVFIDELEKIAIPVFLQHPFPASLEEAKAIKYLGRYFSPKHPLIKDLISSGNESINMNKRLSNNGLIELQHPDLNGKLDRLIKRHELAHYLRDKNSGFKGDELYNTRLKRFKEEFIAELSATKRIPEYKNKLKRYIHSLGVGVNRALFNNAGIK
jgi:hypothetical protein